MNQVKWKTISLNIIIFKISILIVTWIKAIKKYKIKIIKILKINNWKLMKIKLILKLQTNLASTNLKSLIYKINLKTN